MIGRTFSHFEIVDEISRGGMGVVYRALDTTLIVRSRSRCCPDDWRATRAERERFLKEARAAGGSSTRTSASFTKSARRRASASSRWS